MPPAPVPLPIPAPGSTVTKPKRKRPPRNTQRGNAGGAPVVRPGPRANTAAPAAHTTANPKKPPKVPWNPLSEGYVAPSLQDIKNTAQAWAAADIKSLMATLPDAGKVRSDIAGVTGAGVNLMNRGNEAFTTAAAGAPASFLSALGSGQQQSGVSSAAIAAGGGIQTPQGAGDLMGAMGASIGAGLQSQSSALAARGTLEANSQLSQIAKQRSEIAQKQPALFREYLAQLQEQAMQQAVARDNSRLAREQLAVSNAQFGITSGQDQQRIALQASQQSQQAADDEAKNAIARQELAARIAAIDANPKLTDAQKAAAKKAATAKAAKQKQEAGRSKLLGQAGKRVDSMTGETVESQTPGSNSGYNWDFQISVPKIKEGPYGGMVIEWVPTPAHVTGGNLAEATAKAQALAHQYDLAYQTEAKQYGTDAPPSPPHGSQIMGEGQQGTAIGGTSGSTSTSPRYQKTQIWQSTVRWLTSQGIGKARAEKFVTNYMGFDGRTGPAAGTRPSGP